MPKFHQSSFKIGHIYEFHASFQERSDAEIAEKKKGVPPEKHFLIDRAARLNSKYNGFWLVTGIDNEGIHVVRQTNSDLEKRFPRGLREKDVSQSSLFDFMGDNNE